MTIRTKHNVIVVFLIAFAVWPAVHFVLVHALDISPWKGAGWAMYTTPPQSISLIVYRVEKGVRAERLDLVPPNDRARFELQQAYDRFGVRRVFFNTLIRPDGFAKAIFRHYPAEDEIEFEIRRFSIDRKTGHVVRSIEDTLYRYRRDEFSR